MSTAAMIATTAIPPMAPATIGTMEDESPEGPEG